MAAAIKKCNASNAELIFVLDESGSVGSSNFLKSKNFVKDVIAHFEIGPQATQVGIVTFSSYPNFFFPLNRYQDKTSLLNAVSNLAYRGGSTNTGGALHQARTQLLTEANGMRTGAYSKVVIVLTDGYSNYNSYPLADEAEKLKKEAIVVGVGVGGYNLNELKLIASKDDYIYTMVSFSDLATFIQEL